jgi:hypothetical protein
VFLRHGDRITLGASCQLGFSQPVPASHSARLDVSGGHRLFRPVDAVLLMADTLVLGPGQAHVTIDELTDPIILFRHKDGLALRHAGPLTVDGRPQSERGAIEPGSHVRPITLALEAVSRKVR